MKPPPISNPTAIRIRKARAWLSVNSQSYCKEYKKQYLPIKWEHSLKVYEQLVDECPIPEIECWSYDGVVVEDMEPYEVEFLIMSGIDPSLDPQPTLV